MCGGARSGQATRVDSHSTCPSVSASLPRRRGLGAVPRAGGGGSLLSVAGDTLTHGDLCVPATSQRVLDCASTWLLGASGAFRSGHFFPAQKRWPATTPPPAPWPCPCFAGSHGLYCSVTPSRESHI